MKKILALAFFGSTTIMAQAQKIFGTVGEDIKSEIENYFIPVIAGGWLLGALICYLSTMIGENRDGAKFFKALLVMTGAVAIIATAYKYISGMTL